MSANRWILAGVVVLAILVVVAGRWLWSDAEAPVASVEPPVLRPIGDTRLPELPPGGETVAAPLPAQESPLLPMPESTVDAAESMAKAMKHGDPDAPQVVRDTTPREAPTPEELADPKAYQRYEARQTQRLYSQYVRAADEEIPRLQRDIQRAREAGLPPEQIAEGEEKLRRIQAMRDQLRADNPGLP